MVERYDGRELVLGSDDCVHMISYGLHLLGCKKSSLVKAGSYKTEAGALRALRRAGYANLKEAVAGQGFFELDAPAFAWPCDILAMKAVGTDDVALAFMASNGRGFGFFDGKAQFFQPLAIETAWRVA